MTDPTDAVAFAAESAMRLMLLELLKPLIDCPESCSVDVVQQDGSALFIVHVATDDLEKFIGRNTRTGKSLQVVVSAVGAKSQRRFSLTFRDGAGTGAARANPSSERTRT